jgi:hypothetical protein
VCAGAAPFPFVLGENFCYLGEHLQVGAFFSWMAKRRRANSIKSLFKKKDKPVRDFCYEDPKKYVSVRPRSEFFSSAFDTHMGVDLLDQKFE